ncbi:MAG: hypothetical protein OHK0053_13240 [Microscillaceae bacterium]
MWSFLYPYYAWAFLGLLVPLLVHLWNRQKAPVRKVGSVAWLPETAPPRWRQLRFHEPFLFLLRCVLLGWLVLMLMEWRSPPKRTKDQAWYLVAPEWAASLALKPKLDSLRQSNVPIKLFTVGFPEYSGEAALPPKPKPFPENYLSLLYELARQNSLPDSLYLLAPLSARHFPGHPLPLPTRLPPLEWQVAPDTSQAHFPLWAFYTSPGDSLVLYEAHSRATSTSLTRRKAGGLAGKPTAGNIDGLRWENGQLFLSKNPLVSVALPEADTLRIGLFTEQPKSQSVLRAALEVIRDFIPYPLENQVYKTESLSFEPGKRPAIGFWLSEKPIPESLFKQIPHWLLYQAQPGETSITPGVWQGRPVHFLHIPLDDQHPALGQLPEALLNWIFREDTLLNRLARFDYRQVDKSTWLKNKSIRVLSKNKSPQAKPSLQAGPWLLFFVLLLGERYWSYRKQYA